MKSYTKVYLDSLGRDETSFCECEICEGKATEIHHIIARSKYKDGLNKIENLMGICRSCHNMYGDQKSYMVLLLKIHRAFISNIGLVIDEQFFNEMINRYAD